MHPSKEIDAKILAYFERRIGLDELRAWFRETAGSLFDTEDARILDLAASLQLALVEYDKGEFSERQLKRYLKQSVGDLHPRPAHPRAKRVSVRLASPPLVFALSANPH